MTNRRLSSVASELLLLRCQGGDERALAALYAHWSPRLARHAWRLTGRRDAVADVCQESWLAIVRGIARLDDPARFPAWAYRIVSRRCADWIRERTRRAASMTPLADEPAVTTPDRADVDDLARLRHALRKLPREQQAALGLYYGEGLSVKQVALALDIPAGTVKSRLHHGRHALSQILERTPS